MRSTLLLTLFVATGLLAAPARVTPEQRIAPGIAVQRDIQVAVNPTGHVLAAWGEQWSIDVALDGVVLPGAHFSQLAGTYALASGASTFLVVWRDGARVVARRIGVNGAILDVVPLNLCPINDSSSPGVLFDGRDYVVTCTGREAAEDELATRIVRVAESGSVTDDVRPRIALDEVRPLLANGRLQLAGARIHCCHSTPIVYAWADILTYDVNDTPETRHEWIYSDRIVWSAAAGPERVIVAVPENKLFLAQTSLDHTFFRDRYVLPQLANIDPAAATIVWDGSEYVIVWTELRGQYDYAVRGLRLNRAGEPIDDAPFEIAPESHLVSPAYVTVADRGVVIAYSRREGDETHAYIRTLERLTTIPRRSSARH